MLTVDWDTVIDRMDPADLGVIARAAKDPNPALPKMGDVDLRLGPSFQGFTRGPGGIVLSFVGWAGVAGVVEVTVFQNPQVAVSVGAEGFYNRPFLLERMAEWLLSYAQEGTELDLYHRGVAGRASVHMPTSGIADPYFVALLGAEAERYAISYDGNLGTGSAEYSTKGGRVGVGFGVNAVAASGVTGGAELRYSSGFRHTQSASVDVVTPGGEPLFQFSQEKWMAPPRGFSWSFSLGYRF